MLCFTLLGAASLFLGAGRGSACASAAAFVIAIAIKPTCVVVALAAALSLAYGRSWGRLRDFAVSGVVAAAAALLWMVLLSDGIFSDILRFQIERLGTRHVGMWSIDSGFADLRRILHVETRWQWALLCLRIFWFFPARYLPMVLFAVAFLAVPIWVRRCARTNPALGAFAVLWPTSYLVLNFVALDYVSAKNFIPFLAFTSLLLAGLVWWAQGYVGSVASRAVTLVACGAFVSHFAWDLSRHADPWYYGRTQWITREHPAVASFSPMIFASTGVEPGCDFTNPAITYGGYGEAVLGASARTRAFHFSDDRLIECLQAHPEMRLVVDFWFYFFTRANSSLRSYLRGAGSEQVLFFSPQALAQWDHPHLTNADVSR